MLISIDVNPSAAVNTLLSANDIALHAIPRKHFFTIYSNFEASASELL